MNIELNQQECQNVKTALILTAKQAGVGENEMGVLLMLAQKFTWVEEKKDDKTK